MQTEQTNYFFITKPHLTVTVTPEHVVYRWSTSVLIHALYRDMWYRKGGQVAGWCPSTAVRGTLLPGVGVGLSSPGARGKPTRGPPPSRGSSISPIDSLAFVGRMEGEGLTNRTQSENPITVVGIKVAINFLACSLQRVTDHSLDCSHSPFFAPKAHHVS